MSYVFAVPETMSAAAGNLASIGSAVTAANRGAASAITGVLVAADDEVSAAVAALFSAHGREYQELGSRAVVFHEQFVLELTGAAGVYSTAEAAGAAPLAASEQALFALGQEIQQIPGELAAGIRRVFDTVFTTIFGAPALPPFPATQPGGFSGTPSLINRLETAAMYPVQPLLSLTGLQAQLGNPGSPLLQIIASDIPPLSWFIGNSPPPLLNFLLGETVQYSSYDGMRVVQITPANPTGEYVVAIHGGGFIFPPSFLHWINYSVTAHMTGATYQVPIYPLMQEGGTAGLVVPTMAGFISSQIAQHGAANVSVTGDSAGGNLALAAVEHLVANGDPVPSSLVLLSPWLDLGLTNPNIGFVQDPILPVGLGQQIGRVWAGGLPLTDPMVSPLYGGALLSGLPPTYVYSSNLDMLSPDVFRLQDFAAGTNAPINFVLANGQFHDWVLLSLDGLRYWPQINAQLGIAA
ncbi:PE domain-containing protein [Mycobacterium sp.]|uniref:triacylglycerol lipase LipY n=1 Tax=Mycobacterium sp. TaxID=1785 RepID=UPI003A858657